MILWRISRYASLDGVGGMLASGRWHTAPRAVLYCADHPASALLEVLVHLSVRWEEIPDGYRLIRLYVPDDLQIYTVAAAAMPELWQGRPDSGRGFGDNWFDHRESAALRVPSAIVQHAWNVIINTEHVDTARIQIVG